ncbi:OST2 Dolichyl-diphosphooligosaccharide--protein glycosyltransferase subunit OST2 [Candida maltosa Xu316]|uniref:Dolichyl-diphosphooligosaccharide--protein glycosyltransferase subunit OST2 n=1 Tax=Candida maltosa (strain Xu316) TaxID=1245528 RepID=M3K3K7_CANMX|nr:Dolichyl-diphosphooligosaccharide--protein glycosyltransferase epsilon subunit [Candida maltosa Xu316]
MAKNTNVTTPAATNGASPIKKSTGRPSIATTINELKSTIDTTLSNYFDSLTPKLKLIDIFLTFLVLLGVINFVYVLLIGNFPFNAFLGSFISCVGQFVLLVSLRLQINEDNGQKFFKDISPERAFGDFIFASLILHFIVIHFIN